MTNISYNDQEIKGQQPLNESGKQKRIKCPSCGSTKLQYITETETKIETSGGGYSGSKGCLGYLLLGPFGLLCGNCGKPQKTTVTDFHKHFWVCSDCGCKFPTLEDLEAEIQQKKQALKGVGPVFICCAILFIMGIILDFFLLTAMGVFFAVFVAILIPLLIKEINTKESEYAELEKKVKM